MSSPPEMLPGAGVPLASVMPVGSDELSTVQGAINVLHHAEHLHARLVQINIRLSKGTAPTPAGNAPDTPPPAPNLRSILQSTQRVINGIDTELDALQQSLGS